MTITGCTLFNDEWKKWKRFLTNGAEKLVRRRDRKASNEKSSLFVSPPVSSFIETYSWLSTRRNNVTARHDALYAIIIEPREPSAGGVNLDRPDNRIVCRLFWKTTELLCNLREIAKKKTPSSQGNFQIALGKRKVETSGNYGNSDYV